MMYNCYRSTHVACRRLFSTTWQSEPPRLTKNMVQLSFSKSKGPGGQHVNTTSSRVDARFSIDSSWLHVDTRHFVKAKFNHFINKQGEVIVVSQKSRSQHENVADCIEKLQSIVDVAHDAAAKRRRLEFRGERLLREQQHRRGRNVDETRVTTIKKTRRRAKKPGYKPIKNGKMYVWRYDA